MNDRRERRWRCFYLVQALVLFLAGWGSSRASRSQQLAKNHVINSHQPRNTFPTTLCCVFTVSPMSMNAEIFMSASHTHSSCCNVDRAKRCIPDLCGKFPGCLLDRFITSAITSTEDLKSQMPTISFEQKSGELVTSAILQIDFGISYVFLREASLF